jgi:tryptophan synthase alpha chain
MLIAYLPLGDPAVPRGLVEVYIDCGVDVLEVPLPVPNPYVDGETIQASMQRMRERGIGVPEVAMRTARIRKRHPSAPIVWMTYGPLVPPSDLVRLATRAAVDGVLFVEPARHFAHLAAQLRASGVHFLHFLPRNPSKADLDAARSSGGYVMVQAVPGRTGGWSPTRKLPDSAAVIRRMRRAEVTTPIALGVGIRTPEQARQAVAMGADGVVVGSEMVRQAVRGREAVAEYLTELREALS